MEGCPSMVEPNSIKISINLFLGVMDEARLLMAEEIQSGVQLCILSKLLISLGLLDLYL